MKKILILTDFSDNSRNAANIAIDLAVAIDADIFLLHSYLIPFPILTPTEVGIWPDNDIAIIQPDYREELEKEKHRLSLILKNKPGRHMLKTILKGGDIAPHVRKIVESKHIDLVIMAGRNKPQNDFLFGSDTKDVLKKAACPILIIPYDTKALKLNTIVFATDLAASDLKAIHKTVGLFENVKLHIDVTHVSKPVIIADFREDQAVAEFMASLARLDLNRVSYRNLRGDNFIHELDKFCELADADIMAMTYKKHAFIWNLFFQSRCKEVVDKQRRPLLIIPEK